MSFGKILEVSEQTSKGGRRRIRMILLTIHKEHDAVNDNGLHWDEKYITERMDSVEGMGIYASFLDADKRVPFDHGMTEIREIEGLQDCLFENSIQVGNMESCSIEDMEIDGVMQRVLVANGYLSYQRYPHFVEWLKENMIMGNPVKCSIEITGLPENDNKIVYEPNGSQERRVPVEFSFSGVAILSVKEADSNAYVLEVAQKSSGNNINKEENELDAKEMRAIIEEAIKATLDQNSVLSTQVSELNESITTKDETIAKLQGDIEALQTQLAEATNKLNESNAALEPLQNEINEMNKAKAINEMEIIIRKYTEDEQKFAEDLINEFNADPLAGDIEAIEQKILAGIGNAAVADRQVAEQNAKKQEEPEEKIDIFAGMDRLVDDNESEINIFA